MERRPLNRGIVVGLALTLVALALAVASVLRRHDTRRLTVRSDTIATLAAPNAARIRVEVLNATTTRGLARRATRFLRDRGFDVVDLGTANERLDSVVVIDRSGHPDMARKVADAFGGAVIQTRPDSLRYLDVTVLVGRSWRAPPTSEPFSP